MKLGGRAADLQKSFKRHINDMMWSSRGLPPPMELDDIPTIQRLYHAGRLQEAAKDRERYPCDESLLGKVSLLKGDITRLRVDAIVNAANWSLLGGGGVDGAIHRAAGSQLFSECKKLRGCDTGDAKITLGYRLPSKHVIHTVGPIYYEYSEEEASALLRQCYHRSLQLAADNGLRSIAFCSISTGVYGYPIVDATRIALDTTREYLDADDKESLDRVIFVTFSEDDTTVYRKLIPQYFPNYKKTRPINPEQVPLPPSPGPELVPLPPSPQSPTTFLHDPIDEVEPLADSDSADVETMTNPTQKDLREVERGAGKAETIGTASFELVAPTKVQELLESHPDVPQTHTEEDAATEDDETAHQAHEIKQGVAQVADDGQSRETAHIGAAPST